MTLAKSDLQKIQTNTESTILSAINSVVVPALDDMETRIKKELGQKIDSLDRKFDAQQERQDRHNQRIEKLEKIHPKGKHSFI